ncbi:hypothetical protein GGR57DRAFT_447980 [Xylariaceae sp. FL1272]|nr:hypothetical protein GGR57DRAFT_447980 [Xylariaceae sp. FL1272]
MQRRREHFECDSRPGLGCLVLGTNRCAYKRSFRQRCERWLRIRLSIEVWWLLLAVVPVFFACAWASELASWKLCSDIFTFADIWSYYIY